MIHCSVEHKLRGDKELGQKICLHILQKYPWNFVKRSVQINFSPGE